MRRRCGLLVGAVVFAVLAAIPAWAGKVDSGICPIGWGGLFNANGVGCTFCSNPDQMLCENTFGCLGHPPQQPCDGEPDVGACCEQRPCAFGCPDFESLECNVASCSCESEECCKTICPTAPSPALGSPVSPTFGIVAAALALAGAFVLMRQRVRRQGRYA